MRPPTGVPMGTEEADKAIAGWLNQNTGGLLSEETGNIRTDGNDLAAAV